MAVEEVEMFFLLAIFMAFFAAYLALWIALAFSSWVINFSFLTPRLGITHSGDSGEIGCNHMS